MTTSRHQPLRTIVYLAFSIVAATVTGVAWYGFQSAEQIIGEINKESEGAHHLLEDIGEIKYITAETQRLALESILSGDKKLLLQTAIQADRFYGIVTEMTSHLEEDDAEIEASLVQLKQAYREHLAAIASMAGDIIEGLEAGKEKLRHVSSHTQQLHDELDHLTEALKADAEKDIAALNERSKRVFYSPLLSAAIILSIILSLFFLFKMRLLSPLWKLQGFTERLSQENTLVGTRIEHPYNDEIGNLYKSINHMLDNLDQVTVSRDQLIVAKQEAEQASNAKSDFLSRMSHELRTPMNAILGFSQILEMDDEHPLNEIQLDQVHEISKAGHHLLELINEVLDLAKVESGRIELSVEPIPYNEVLNECLSLAKPLAAQRQISIYHNAAQASGFCVRADRIRIKQVILNLLSNAIKYNKDHGTITLELMQVDGEWVRLRITDSGAGIPPGQMQDLFQPFNRLGAEQGETEGTGIGLALSKRLIEMQKGTIGVESIPGNGSCFWIDLPTCELTSPAAEDTHMPANSYYAGSQSRNRKVLYIEDNPSNLKMVEHLLSRRPHITLLSALNPTLGLELAAAHQPDLILLDIQLPDFNGYEVLKRLQADEKTNQLPVVAISANAMPRDIAKGRAAGFMDYLTKPLDTQRFMQLVDETLRD
jgi:signal transduction histidine kinase